MDLTLLSLFLSDVNSDKGKSIAFLIFHETEAAIVGVSVMPELPRCIAWQNPSHRLTGSSVLDIEEV